MALKLNERGRKIRKNFIEKKKKEMLKRNIRRMPNGNMMAKKKLKRKTA